MDDFDNSDLTALFAEVDKLEAQRKPPQLQCKVSINVAPKRAHVCETSRKPSRASLDSAVMLLKLL